MSSSRVRLVLILLASASTRAQISMLDLMSRHQPSSEDAHNSSPIVSLSAWAQARNVVAQPRVSDTNIDPNIVSLTTFMRDRAARDLDRAVDPQPDRSQSECYTRQDASDYAGRHNVTRSGAACRRWAETARRRTALHADQQQPPENFCRPLDPPWDARRACRPARVRLRAGATSSSSAARSGPLARAARTAKPSRAQHNRRPQLSSRSSRCRRLRHLRRRRLPPTTRSATRATTPPTTAAAETANGHTCQQWTAQLPNQHPFHPGLAEWGVRGWATATTAGAPAASTGAPSAMSRTGGRPPALRRARDGAPRARARLCAPARGGPR